MIGLKRGTVKLVKHNPAWEKSFEREAKKIRKVLGKDTLVIEHVGSTAIPGIPAKPIIDIALVVPALKRAKNRVGVLREIGYNLKPEVRKDRLFFTKGPEKKRTHYLHVGEAGSRYAEDMILFRDYLRRHKEAAKTYGKLKAQLAKKFQAKRVVYTAKKEKWIKMILRKAKSKTCACDI